jgi:hypothetical protein
MSNDYGIDYLLELLEGKSNPRLMNSHVITQKRLQWVWRIEIKDQRAVVCSGSA